MSDQEHVDRPTLDTEVEQLANVLSETLVLIDDEHQDNLNLEEFLGPGDDLDNLANTTNLIRSYKVLVKEGQSGLSGTTVTGKRWSLPHCEALDIFLDSSDAFLLLITSEGRIIHASSTFYSLLAYSPESVVAGDKGIGDISEQLRSVISSFSEEQKSGTSKLVTLYFRQSSEDNDKQILPFYDAFKCQVNKVLPLKSPTDEMNKDTSCIFKEVFLVTGLFIEGVSDCRDLLLADYGCDYSFNIRIEKNGIIASVDAHAAILLGYTVKEIVDMSVFDFIHPYHVNVFGDAISKMIENGFAETKPYRLMTKGGKWIWCQSRCIISANWWTNDAEYGILKTKLIPPYQLPVMQRIDCWNPLVSPIRAVYEQQEITAN